MKRVACGIALALGLAVSAVNARDLFIDVNGRGAVCNDANPGTEIDRPLCTIAAALRSAGPGDRIIVREGTYPESVVPRSDGTVEEPIVIRSFEGETATISGAESLTAPGRIVANDRRLLEIERATPPIGFIQTVDGDRALGPGCPARFGYVRDDRETTAGNGGPREGYWHWDGKQSPGRAYVRISKDVARCEAAGAVYRWLEVVREIDLSRRRHIAFEGIRFEDVTLRIASEGSVRFEECVFASASVTSSLAPESSAAPTTQARAGNDPTIVSPDPPPCGLDCDPPVPGDPLPHTIEEGGTGASDPVTARANLGAASEDEVLHLAGSEVVSGPKAFVAPGIGVDVAAGMRAGSVGIGTDPTGNPGDLSVAGAVILGANKAIYWPTTNPVATHFFEGTTGSGSFFHDQDDNVICRAYNTDCTGEKFVATEHTFKEQMEATYDSTVGPGVVEAVEMNWDFSPDNSPYSWRPFHMFLNTAENDGDGVAQFQWQLQRGDVLALELKRNQVAVNRDPINEQIWGTFNVFARLEGAMWDSEFGQYTMAKARHTNSGIPYDYVGSITSVAYESTDPATALGGMYGLRTNLAVVGDNPSRVLNRAIGHEINLDVTGSGTARNWTGLDVEFRPTGSDALVDGKVALINLASPSLPGPGTTVAEYSGIDIADQRGLGTSGNPIVVRTQSGGAARGNIVLQGGAWNNGHLGLGPAHLWFDSGSQRLRVSASTPGSANSGNALVAGTASDTHGPAAWAVPGTSGTSACAAMGLTCVDGFGLLSPGKTGCTAVNDVRVVMCK